MDRRELIRIATEISDPASWQDAARKWPKQIAPTIERVGYVRRPLPGYVGSEYEKARIVFLGTNPGGGKGHKDFRDWDVALFKTVLPSFCNSPDEETFTQMNSHLSRVMLEWPIFQLIDFPHSFGMAMGEIAYSNVLLVNTPDGVRPHEVASEAFQYSIQRFLAPWLAALDPKLVIVFGKGAAKHLKSFWNTRPGNLQIEEAMSPTRQVMNTHRRGFLESIERAKTAVARAYPPAKRCQRRHKSAS